MLKIHSSLNLEHVAHPSTSWCYQHWFRYIHHQFPQFFSDWPELPIFILPKSLALYMINNHFLGITWWEATKSITHSTSLLATCSHFCSSIESTTTVVIFFSLSFLSSLPSVCFFIPMPTIFYYMAIFPTIEAFSSFFILRSIS